MATYIYPVPKHITQGFGVNPDYYRQFGQHGHNGIDLADNIGTPVRASADGTIAFEGWGQLHGWMGAPAGICVLIRHAKMYTGYAHLERTVVNRGQHVMQGQIIGYSGQTGAATGPHTHFEFLPLSPDWYNGYAGRVNPNPYLSTPTPAPAKVYYLVNSGDTMSGIAAKYKTTLTKLKQLNPSIKNVNQINVKQKIRVK